MTATVPVSVPRSLVVAFALALAIVTLLVDRDPAVYPPVLEPSHTIDPVRDPAHVLAPQSGPVSAPAPEPDETLAPQSSGDGS